MWRTLPVCAWLLLPSLAVRAADAPKEMVIRLTVQPMPLPKPALKYQLLPELREMNPGNPIQAYYKCFAEQHNFWKNKEIVQKRENWQTMPLRDLPLEEIRKSGHARGSNPFRFADHAARLDSPDWQILVEFKRDGPLLLLPDVQQLRELAAALKVRFRVEVADRHFDDALATAKTMLALSRHLGENPTLICELVAIAVGSLALGPIDEMIEQPGCPNLFWALTDLPRPFIDLHKGVQGDRMMITTDVFASLTDDAPMNESQGQNILERLRRLVKEAQVNADVDEWMKKLSQDEDYLRQARKRLIDSGLTEAKVKQFPAPQVIFLDEKREFLVYRDECRKAMSLPYWQAEPILTVFDSRRQRPFAPLSWLGGMGYLKVKTAQTRLDQRIALLSCVEALRMYAAEHDGKLPAKLDDIRLPLPVDPAAGKPFSYKVDGKTAHLQGVSLGLQVRYEVTIGN
ncbi:MAG TPA: hypothetical protein VH592_02790 [Gemmataceae bacterium]|jgi:hypothetical protein